MRLITSPKTILGLDISDLSVKAVQIEKKGEHKYIRAINSAEIPTGLIEDDAIKNNEALAEIIKQLLKNSLQKFSTRYVVMSLPETKTFIKVIEVAIGDLTTEEAIQGELPRHIPIAMEAMQLDWQEIEANKQHKKILVGAVPKTVSDEYVRVAEMAGLTPVALEIEAQAIARCLLPAENKKNTKDWWRTKKEEQKKEKNREGKPPQIIIDFGATRTSVIFMDRGIIQFTNSLPNISGQKITAEISKQLKLSTIEAEKAKIICGTNPKKCKGATMKIINGMVGDLANEIINADNFYQTHFNQETNNLSILLGGGGANMVNLDKTLSEKLGRPVCCGDPLINLEIKKNRRDDLLSFSTAIGLALRNFVS